MDMGNNVGIDYGSWERAERKGTRGKLGQL